MPHRTRQRREPTEDWQQLRLLAEWPEQEAYELIRPIVLFGQSPAERAKQTGAAERTLRRRATHFDSVGMASLFGTTEPRTGERDQDRRALPPHLRQLLVDLAVEYPALRPKELARICYIASGRRPSPHTIKRVLADGPPPSRTGRRYPPYHEITDPAEARLAIVRLHSEGWTVTSIAGYLATSRQTIYTILRRWVEEGVRGLDDKARARPPGARKADLRAVQTVRRLQENPTLGEWRIHAALKRLGIRLSPRTCGRILALNRHLYQLPGPREEPKPKKTMPFAGRYRHEYWSVDVRYIEARRHQLGGGDIYVISILENYSRAILASAVSRSQDLTAYLLVLFAAVRQHGSPIALVSDGGSIFKATQARAIYKALNIRKERIKKRQSWQNLIETHFNTQRRMADFHFERAQTWEEMLAAHEQWVVAFNYQEHWAHRERQDNRHSPAEVLGWTTGAVRTPEQLHRIFYATRFGRLIDGVGYVRFRCWRIYGERGLAKKKAVVWLYRETLTIEFSDQPVSQYTVAYQRDAAHLRTITDPHLFDTPFRSPQLPLWELGEGEWLKVVRRPPRAPRRPHLPIVAVQEPLFALDAHL